MYQTSVPQVYKTNTSELKRTDRSRYNNSGRSQHTTLINIQNILTECNKHIIEVNNTMGKMDLTDIYREFHTAVADHRFFLAAHGNYTLANWKVNEKQIS
jgi:hypothetical protein